MTTLLVRLAGPMQSWGTQSRFGVRDTGLEPSKSGLVGLFCAALGRPRNEPVDDLAALRMAVRVDKEGSLKRDYHTAGGGTIHGKPHGVIVSSGRSSRTELSNRYYLSDADFLIALESTDVALLQRLHQALEKPVWQTFLGRKSFVPGVPPFIQDGLQSVPLESALKLHWPEGKERLRIVRDATPDDHDAIRSDHPISFEHGKREFTIRYVKTEWMDCPLTINHQS